MRRSVTVALTSPPTSEQQALFNAGFLATMLHSSAKGYHGVNAAGIPLPLVYLAVPTALHEPSRDALPRRSNAQMIAWLHENPLVIHDLPRRVHDLRPFVSEGLILALQTQAVNVEEGGRVTPLRLNRRSKTLRPTSDWLECMKAAEFMGKWLAQSQLDTSTALAIWGFKP